MHVMHVRKETDPMEFKLYGSSDADCMEAATLQVDRQTYRHADCNTFHLCWVKVIIQSVK